MINIKVREFMAREYEHIKRSPSRKDPNYVSRLRQERRAYPHARNPQAPLDNIQDYSRLGLRHPGSLRVQCYKPVKYAFDRELHTIDILNLGKLCLYEVNMSLQEIETEIFNCGYVDSTECEARIRCHPTPGCGSADPKFLVLGINPGRRRDVWCRFNSMKELKHQYLAECIDPRHSYGRLLERLGELVQQFDIRNTVYLSDLVKCPTRERGVPDMMIRHCVSTYLEKTVRVLDPKFIIGLGRPSAIYLGGFSPYVRLQDLFSNRAALLRRIMIADRNHWFILAPHPDGGIAEVETIATDIHEIVKEPETSFASKLGDVFSSVERKEVRNMIEQKLINLRYRKAGTNRWIKENLVIHTVQSSEFGSRVRIRWMEKWKDDHAIIYNYSGVGGPVCVVPISVLFKSAFIKKKRMNYANSKDRWSQPFPREHELAKLVLSFKNRWDLL